MPWRIVAFMGSATAVGAIVGWSCAAGEVDDGSDVTRPDASDVRDDGAADVDVADAVRCDANSQCDDEIDCTDDFCSASGFCGHQPIHELCPPGQRCNAVLGCAAVECTEDAHCDDGLWCTGIEQCIANHCLPGAERDCDDGDPCTDNRCDEAEDKCVRDRADIEGCELDTGRDEAADPFDPAVHYSGAFMILPGQRCTWGSGGYSFDTARFSVAGDTLSVTGPPCAMEQTPAPTTAEFSVACVQAGCGRYELTGRFLDADTFTGRWMVTFVGRPCSLCPSQDTEVTGVRL